MKHGVLETDASSVVEEVKNGVHKEIEEVKSPGEKKKWIASFKKDSDKATITSQILAEINTRASTIVQLWNQYLEVVILVPHPISSLLNDEFDQARAEVFGHFIHRSETKVASFPFQVSRDVTTEHQSLVKVMRGSVISKGINEMSVSDI